MATASSGSSAGPAATAAEHSSRCSRRFFFVSLVVSRALQDLYEDWSAIYRNRIPPYLTLPPLARFSRPPLCFTDSPSSSSSSLSPLSPLSLFPSRSFALLLAALIQSFAAQTLSFFVAYFLSLCSSFLSLSLSSFLLLLRAVFSIPYSAIIIKIVVLVPLN